MNTAFVGFMNSYGMVTANVPKEWSDHPHTKLRLLL